MERKKSASLILYLVVAVLASFAYEAVLNYTVGEGWLRDALGPGLLFLLALGMVVWQRFGSSKKAWDEPLILIAVGLALIAVGTAGYWWLERAW